MLSLLFALTLAAPSAAAAQPVVESSAEDCAVFAAMGRETLQWREEARTWLRSDVQPLSGANTGAYSGIYRLTCPWAELGLVPPTDSPAPRETFDLYRPIYSAWGRVATVAYDTQHYGHHRDPWRVTETERRKCTLRKTGGVWRVQACRVRVVRPSG